LGILFKSLNSFSFRDIKNNNFFEKIITKTGLEKYTYKGEEVLFASTKIRLIEGKNVPVDVIGDIWTDIGINNLHKEGEVAFENGKKPLKLIKRLINILVENSSNSIILDFFGGSGSTAQAVLDLNKEDGGNRQFIVCEQMDYAENITKERIKQAIGKNKQGSFVYLELKKHNENFIEKIRDSESTDKLLEVWEEMKNVSFLNYNIDLKEQNNAIEELKTHSLEVQKQKLASVLDKNQLYVSLSNIDDAQYGVTEQEKEFTKTFYQND
jgi:adenine-specific DNA-methyltransferase